MIGNRGVEGGSIVSRPILVSTVDNPKGNPSDKKGYFVGKPDPESPQKGWFYGNFMGDELLHSEAVEVAKKILPEQDMSSSHYHKVATELTFVIKGCCHLEVEGDGTIELSEGEFIVVHPGTPMRNPKNDPGTEVLVIKFPSVPGDKYYVED